MGRVESEHVVIATTPLISAHFKTELKNEEFVFGVSNDKRSFCEAFFKLWAIAKHWESSLYSPFLIILIFNLKVPIFYQSLLLAKFRKYWP